MTEEEIKNKIFLGDSLAVLKEFPDKSVDCLITSPPYWMQRNYGVDGQLGNEIEFNDYINNLCSVFDEMKRVLKDEGTMFVNLGDTYGTQSGQAMGKKYKSEKTYLTNVIDGEVLLKPKHYHKCLMLIPDRFGIEMINRGWIIRNKIIWQKPNQFPQSVKDRFTVDFEDIFFFVKESKYYFEQQFEPYTSPMNRWGGDKLLAKGESTWDKGTGQSSYRDRNMRPNSKGKNMRTVWKINTKPLKSAHFAVYPEELVKRMILAGCPENGIVLDPFMGSGTTAVVGRKLNRNYSGIELNPDYIKIAEQRLHNEVGLFK